MAIARYVLFLGNPICRCTRCSGIKNGISNITYAQVVVSKGMHSNQIPTIEQRRLFQNSSDWSIRCAAKLNLFAGG